MIKKKTVTTVRILSVWKEYEILILCTEKTGIKFPFKLNGIWSWWQFSFRCWPNGNLFGSKLIGKLSPRSYPIQFERKFNTSVRSALHRSCLPSSRMKDGAFYWINKQLRLTENDSTIFFYHTSIFRLNRPHMFSASKFSDYTKNSFGGTR